MSEDTNGDWLSNRRHVLAEIGRISKAIEEVEHKQDSISTVTTSLHIDMMNLKFRLTAWGVIAAAVPSSMMAFIWWMMHSASPAK